MYLGVADGVTGLLMAEQESRLVITGGTHNPMSPPFHFSAAGVYSVVKSHGHECRIAVKRFGFYPAGGGEIAVKISVGNKLMPLHLESRGDRINAYAESFFAGLPAHIAERELAVVKQKLAWSDEQLLMKEISRQQGPGNVLLITLEHEQVTEVFTGFAERGVAAEVVAKGAVAKAQKYLTSHRLSIPI